MKPAPFTYHRPEQVDEVTALLAEHGDDAVVMAGGQSLTPLLNLRMVRPAVVIDLGRVQGLTDYGASNGHVTIGAMARARAIEDDREIGGALPPIGAALHWVGHPQIRNRGTIGGMVAFADPAAEIPAVLAGCGGHVVVRGTSGERTIDSGEFFTGTYTTACASDELVTRVQFDAPAGFEWSVTEHARRHGDYALAGLVLGAALDERTIRGLRLAFFGVGPSPVRLHDVESEWAGKELDDGAIDAIAAAVEDSLTPPADVHGSSDYRRRIAAVLTRRGLKSLRDGGSRT